MLPIGRRYFRDHAGIVKEDGMCYLFYVRERGE